MKKKIFFVLFGFTLGFIVSNAFFIPELRAQYGFSGGDTFQETEMRPPLPAKYGKLVGISGIDLYFQGADGTVYLVKPRTQDALDTHVTVIKRSE